MVAEARARGVREVLTQVVFVLYSRYDEMGVLFTVVVSDITLQNGLLQVRSRDTTVKESVHVSEASDYICRHISAAHSP